MSENELEAKVSEIVRYNGFNLSNDEARVELMQLIKDYALQARIDEHMNWVLYWTDAAHKWEQDGEGSGIQYFDNERLARLSELKAPHKKERI